MKPADVLRRLEKLAVRRAFTPATVCVGPDGKRFESQYRAIASPHKRKVYFCTRRAGKTEGIASEILLTVLSGEPGIVAYVTQTLKMAKHLVWPIIKRLNRDYQLGGIANESEAYMRFPVDSGFERRIYLGGCKDKTEIERLRGFQKSKAWFLDEMQSVPERIVRPMLDDIVTPSLLDYGGRLVVSGTPGPLPVGYFYDVTAGSLRDEWECHSWTWLENPWIQPGEDRGKLVADLLREKHWTPDTPSYQREYCGKWVTDWNSLVFRYGRDINDYTEAPRLTNFVMGVDFGYDDKDAIAVLGWGPDSDRLYLVEEHLAGDQVLSDLSLEIERLVAKYDVTKVVCDTGGLGKKLAKSMGLIKGIPMEAADKTRKFEHIEFLNDSMRTGKFMARSDSLFAEDCARVQWDEDAKRKGILRVDDSRYHSDICDAVLYAYRAAYHHLWEKPVTRHDADADPFEIALTERMQAESEREWWER